MAPARGPLESQEDLNQTPRYDSQPGTAGARTAKPAEQRDREVAERQGCPDQSRDGCFMSPAHAEMARERGAAEQHGCCRPAQEARFPGHALGARYAGRVQG